MRLLAITLITAALSLPILGSAQTVNNVEEEVKEEGVKRINKNINSGIDAGFDKLEKGIKGLFGKKKKKNKKKESSSEAESKEQNSNTTQQTETSAESEAPKAHAIDLKWNRFDFVPGDDIIFEDAPSINEENGEFPSRWDIVGGVAEIANVDGENVIVFQESSNGDGIVPFLENSKDDYLPEVFTIEFDAFFDKDYSGRYWVNLFDRKNQKYGNNKTITINVNAIDLDVSSGVLPEKRKSNWDEVGGWRHISIAYTKGKIKCYMDDSRLINIPRYAPNPTGVTIRAENNTNKRKFIKNIRIAKGGVKYYDRVMSEGKIICNGIRFDTGKSTLKDESMGPINKIFQLLQKQPDLKFSVEGHTDSDGDDKLNQTLSEARAKTVKDRLISMGIDASRLTSTGWGESKPIGENNTPEGKATNRRVEFVKITGSAVSPSSSSATSSSSSEGSFFDSLDRKSIGDQLEGMAQTPVQIINQSGVINGKGSIILYATSHGKVGKMEILDIDKSDHYKLTVRYVTYKFNGSVHSQSDSFEIPGTYSCDLDKGEIGCSERSDIDFYSKKPGAGELSLSPGSEAIIGVAKR